MPKNVKCQKNLIFEINLRFFGLLGHNVRKMLKSKLFGH